MVLFREADHKYMPAAPWNAGIRYYSVSSFVSSFHEKFDKIGVSESQSVLQFKRDGTPNKWYGIPPEEIRRIWDDEAARSVRIGHMVHAAREKMVLDMKKVYMFGKDLDVWPCLYTDKGEKLSISKMLYEGVHPELLVWRNLSDTIGLAGQSDFPVIIYDDPSEKSGVIHIGDYKTNKELKRENRFRNMYYPFGDMPDCNFYHYTIQLNTYARLIQLNNPGTRIGKLSISHVRFVVAGLDRFGFPIIEMKNGFPVISGTDKIELPVLESDRMDEAFRVFVESNAALADDSVIED